MAANEPANLTECVESLETRSAELSSLLGGLCRLRIATLGYSSVDVDEKSDNETSANEASKPSTLIQRLEAVAQQLRMFTEFADREHAALERLLGHSISSTRKTEN